MLDAAMISWSIWTTRNELIWQNKSRNAKEVVKSARLVLDQWKVVNFESPNAYFATGDALGSKLWRKPDQSTIKVNVDGAIFEDQQKFGFGYIARDCFGALIEAVSGSRRGYVLPEIAEIIGIKEALSWIKNKGWGKVVVESDSLVAVQAIQSSIHMPSQFGLLVEDCRLILSSLNNVQVSFVNRSANKAAHSIARGSCFSSDRIYLESNAPSSLRNIVIADAI
ncbi:hypothetical protein CsatA_018294 [Cannabis sativa]